MTTARPSFLPYGRQSIDSDDIQAVVDVLQSDFLTCGPTIEAFEKAFAEKVGAPHAVVCSNGTAALHLAALALGLGHGDQIIVPTLTFLATASSPHITGADVIFADVDPNTGLMTAETFQDALDRADGPVKAVFPVHLNGGCVDLDAIKAIAKPLGIAIVDDACHALGATINGISIGSAQLSDMSVYSMHPVKTIAMGEGGAITTADGDLAAKLRAYREHGMHRDVDNFVQPDEAFDINGSANPWYYEMPHPGLNYRQSDIQCALGLSQLKKLDQFLSKRRALADAYDILLAPMTPTLHPVHRVQGCEGGWHLYPVLINFEAIGKDRAQVMNELRTLNIGTQVHYLPIHRQPYWRTRQPSLTLPGADAYYARCLSLPLYPAMENTDVETVVSALKSVLSPEKTVYTATDPIITMSEHSVHITKATLDDAMQVYDWQIEPGARSFARNPMPPTPEEHMAWFEKTIQDQNRHMFIVHLDDQPCGVVRADMHSAPDTYEISILISSTARNTGTGTAALLSIRNAMPWAKFIAHILRENTASQAIFAKVGYIPYDADTFISLPAES